MTHNPRHNPFGYYARLEDPTLLQASLVGVVQGLAEDSSPAKNPNEFSLPMVVAGDTIRAHFEVPEVLEEWLLSHSDDGPRTAVSLHTRLIADGVLHLTLSTAALDAETLYLLTEELQSMLTTLVVIYDVPDNDPLVMTAEQVISVANRVLAKYVTDLLIRELTSN
jgi:hypothetical protein